MNYYTRPDNNPDILLWNTGHPMRDISDSHWVGAMEIEGSMIDKVARALSPRSETWF
jgi:hypothetical protein